MLLQAWPGLSLKCSICLGAAVGALAIVCLVVPLVARSWRRKGARCKEHGTTALPENGRAKDGAEADVSVAKDLARSCRDTLRQRGAERHADARRPASSETPGPSAPIVNDSRAV